MKKLLMLGAILVLGATAFAKDSKIDGDANVAEANVTVKAKLVAKNLVITDLQGNPLVLDFETVSKTQESGTKEVEEGFLVKYVGVDALNENNGLTMELKGENGFVKEAVPVRLTSLSQVAGSKADSFKVNVGLDSYKGKLPKSPEDGRDYSEYKGSIFGTLDFAAAAPRKAGATTAKLADLTSGDYQGQTVLKVTLANPVI